jgi:catechol 2,3-dioxygenase-like lactoylglutathione lyase family enzyme
LTAARGDTILPVRVLGFHHHTLLVRDLDRSAAFYDQAFGMPRKARPNFSTRGVWYDLNGLELHLIESDDVPARNEGHPALEVEDIRAAVAASVAAGATLIQDTYTREHDGSLSAFIRDYDENLIELTQHHEPLGQ